jgi:branched-chain amino acid transport system substrate-binding protein
MTAPLRNYRLPIAVATLVIIITGCPQRYNPAAAPRVVSDNPKARQQFGTAKVTFEKGEFAAAEKLFSQFAKEFSNDPLAALSQVYLARILFENGKAKEAKVAISAIPNNAPPAVQRQARYYLGLIQIRLGEYAAGRQILQPFVKDVDDAYLPGTLAALAHAAQEDKDYVGAARHFARLYQVTTRNAEKAWARQNLKRLLAKELDEPALVKLFDQGDKSTLLHALTGKRLAAMATARRDPQQAQKYLQQIVDAAEKHHVVISQAGGKASRAQSIGVLLPLSGPYRAVGQRILAGATAGAESLSATKTEKNFSLVIRDSARNAAVAAEEMVLKDRVAALVGVPNPVTAKAVAKVAEKYQIPFITLSAAAGGIRSGWRLQIVPGIAQRSTALAQRGLTKSGIQVAILAPDNSYGRLMATAFAKAAATLKSSVSQTLFYPPSTRSFTDWAKKLKSKPFKALFVPDSARRLGLIAPALAQAGLWPSSAGKKPPKGRPIRLLATADGVSERLLRVSGRYLEGALLCPGFFAKAHEGGTSPVLQKYRTTHEKPPGLVEAFSFDAVHALHHFVSKGTVDANRLIAALRTETLDGLTGTIRFGEVGQRLGQPTVYVVSDSTAAVHPQP